jgi:hypothetical protein
MGTLELYLMNSALPSNWEVAGVHNNWSRLHNPGNEYIRLGPIHTFHTQKPTFQTHIYKTMSGPRDGLYLIQLAGDPKPLIGVDSSTAIVKPVVAGGNNNVVSPVVFVQRQRHLYHPLNSQSSFSYDGVIC